jgi:TolA-binding protein
MSRFEGGTDPATDGLEAVAALVRQASAAMTPLQRMRGLEAVRRRSEARQRKRRTLLVAGGLSAGGLVAAGMIGLLVARGAREPQDASETSPISYRVDHGEIGDGGYLRAVDREHDANGVSLRFAEGTELRLEAGARGRLTSVDAQGARFAIEQGEAQVNVVPRPGARWLIDAGPFLITVHGTVFSAAWDGVTERLDIKMKHGLVSVTGPVADGKIAVRAGQRLTINVQNREVLLRPSEDAADPSVDQAQDDPHVSGLDDATATAAGTPSAADRALVPSAPPVTAPRPRTFDTPAPIATARANTAGASTPSFDPRRARVSLNAGGGARDRSWTAALAAGDFQSILRAAEHRGLRRSLDEARSEDLAALADAARYLRRDDLARQALIAQRERFPRSDRAREAAFLLGRLTETGSEGDVRALSWYNRYLAEAPGGAYASEALGRKMTATEKLRGLSAAREIARDYLRRFPHGTYAGAARALSEAP